MTRLAEKVKDPEVHEAVIQDSILVLDEEVAKKSGVTGLGFKAAYKLLKSLKKGKALRVVLEALMPDFLEKLDPYFERYEQEGEGKSWSEFIAPHYEAISDEFLAVTDAKAAKSDSSRIRKTYGKLRPKARKEVIASMPGLAKMMDKYVD